MAREKVLCGKEEVIRASVEIVENEGITALSARRIAKELGTSAMTIYNYIENLTEVKKMVITNGFERLYGSIYKALNQLEKPVDRGTFCKTIAMQVFRFSDENKNIFSFMFNEGKLMFKEDAEVRPFYNFISKIARRNKSTREDWSTNEKGYTILEMLVCSLSAQRAEGTINMTESEFEETIDYYLKKCIL